MSNRAWMPLHIDDYLADTGHLSGAEHGAYLLLIMHYWQNGSLPENERLIARIARMDPAQWTDSRDVLAMLFSDGWKHKRIDAELNKADEVIEKRRAAANARHSKKPSDANDANALHVDSKCSDTGALPLTSNQVNYAAKARDPLQGREGEMLAALGVTDETKTPGLLILSEPYNWVTNGCDIDLDILPTLRAIGAKGKLITSWAYCSKAVFEARDRRLAPAPAVQQRQATGPPSPASEPTTGNIWTREASDLGYFDEFASPKTQRNAHGDRTGNRGRAFPTIDVAVQKN
jgi:uncharacterized protein YdaU (DUF1376 family)